MEPIKLDCTYEERKSKNDKLYKAIVIRIGEYEKLVMLSYPEQVLIESLAKTTYKPSDFLE